MVNLVVTCEMPRCTIYSADTIGGQACELTSVNGAVPASRVQSDKLDEMFDHHSFIPIPVSGPFDRIGVNVVQVPKSARGNRYIIVFVDYLIKWEEVFPTPDQSALMTARYAAGI